MQLEATPPTTPAAPVAPPAAPSPAPPTAVELEAALRAANDRIAALEARQPVIDPRAPLPGERLGEAIVRNADSFRPGIPGLPSSVDMSKPFGLRAGGRS